MDDALTMSLDEVEAMNKVAFDQNAEDPDARVPDDLSPFDLIDLFAELVPGSSMLDIGCGWGTHAKHFERHGLRYTGGDLSDKRIAIAQRENPNTEFLVMSFRKIPFPDGSFGGIWCCCALESEPRHNIKNVFKELHRVLIPGGLFFVLSPAYGSAEGVVDESGRRAYSAVYELGELHRAIAQSGFDVTDSKYMYQDGTNVLIAHKVPLSR